MVVHLEALRRHGGQVTGAGMHVEDAVAGRALKVVVVPVLPGDTAETLATRVLQVEHPLLVAALQLAASGRISEQDGIAWLDGQAMFTPLQLQFTAQ